jgi:hypothetical protein
MSRIYPLPMLTPNDVESPTIEEMWLKFSQCIPPGTCPEHVREFRNAFYSGSLGLINEAMKLSRGDESPRTLSLPHLLSRACAGDRDPAYQATDGSRMA